MRDALPGLVADGVVAIGISPDNDRQQKQFDEKHGLGFTLLSDSDNRIAEAYGVWGEKKLYGKTYLGISRSAFLVDEAGNIAATGYKISPKDTIPKLKQWLARQPV